MFRSHTRIIQSCRNGMCQLNVSIFILQQIGTHAMQGSRLSKSHSCRMFSCLYTKSCCFHPDQLYLFFLDKFCKHTDGIRTATYAGHNHIRKFSFSLVMLRFCFFADDTLELFNHLRIRIRTYGRTNNIERILCCFCPGADCLVCGIF